ncbi:MAG: FHA domain-containing protein [Gammaproteobacteria bacterium]|nr:FHA domain-containing protein [Gammaproteobacteria bacterium]
MNKLILMHDGTVIREYPIEKEKTTLGRKPDNDIHLDDPTVSGLHCIFLLLQNVYVEDMNSTNGVLLNGKKVTKRQLENGDIVRIGRHELKFVDEKAHAFDSTVVISPGQIMPAGSKKAEQTKSYIVKAMSGPDAGNILELSRAYTTLGKPGGQVAVIARRGDGFHFMQMGGTTADKNLHPRINGQTLTGASVPLNAGDELEVGGNKFVFTASD